MIFRTISSLLLLLVLFSCAGPAREVKKTSVSYGYRLFSLGLYDEADFHYRMMLRNKDLTAEEKARILNNLAVIFEMKEEYLKAREMYREALETDSNGDIYENYKKFMGGL
ncbi:tetratricopeptide repeat protein [Candidatus Mcinerneyibacteriota bacterium]|nr:tetratricopeptide repeat protein [Candidatus Mcinerneyibacteriota bacterium]